MQLKAGLSTEKKQILVTREEVHTYCLAIDEQNKVYHCVTAAKQAGYTDVLLPTTYPSLFWQSIKIPWLKEQSYLVLTKQTFHYMTPLFANTEYHCYIVLEKTRSSHKKQFLQHKLYITYRSEIIATSITTLYIIQEKVT